MALHEQRGDSTQNKQLRLCAAVAFSALCIAWATVCAEDK